ncbi:MAG: NAD-dependent epimerase/dehydratase family protein [Parvibaculaceae bacterium]
MKLLITGAAGDIGRVLREGLAGRYELLRLADIVPQAPAAQGEECVTFDGNDLEATVDACRGMDCVVHLAGIPNEPEEDAWERLLRNNIVATRNVFEAARRTGVNRVVFASSNHVVGFLRREVMADARAEMRPDTLYGVTKVFGEAIGRLYADKYALSVACLRIGSFRARPEDRRQLATWLSHRDAVQLFRRCIEAPDYRFLIVYGVSDNATNFWSNAGLEWLGYAPKDRAEDLAASLAGAPVEDALSRQFHGGSFCAIDFTGDAGRID